MKSLERDLFIIKEELAHLLRLQRSLLIQQEDIDIELQKLDRRRAMLESERATVEIQIELLQGE